MQLNSDLHNKIELLLQKYLKTYFVVIFITTIIGSFYGYLIHHSYKMGDWLINYQGGMIRRGFLGEITYQLSNFTEINPGVYIFLFQTVLYFSFLFFSYLLLKKQRYLLPYSILILSPFLFTFQINDLLGGFRKEIIYIAVLAFVTWSAKTHEHKTFEIFFYLTLLSYPAVILTHEMLAIFLPYIVVVYISVTKLNIKKFLLLFLFLLPSIFSFIAAIYYSGNEFQVNQILTSLENNNYSIQSGGAISFLTKDTSYGINLVSRQLSHNHYIFYLLNLAIAIIAFIPVREKLLYIMRDKLSLLLICTSIVGSIGLFVVAMDWGRFIYIHLVSMFFLLFIPKSNSIKVQTSFLDKLTKKSIIVFFIAYSLFWHIPHAGTPFKKTFRQQNFVAFAIPYANVLRFYYQSINGKK